MCTIIDKTRPVKKGDKIMTDDRAVELINEWLGLAKEIGDMNLNRMVFDRDRYNYAMNRIEEIREQVEVYNQKIENFIFRNQ